MKLTNKFATLCIIASAILMACSTQSVATLTASSATTTPVTTSISTLTNTATATQIPTLAMTSTPNIPTPIKVNSATFCVGEKAPWSCSCGHLSNEFIQIDNATHLGWCDVTVPFYYHKVGGYKISLPDNWFCNIAGYELKNLLCFTVSNQKIFIESFISELPITQADKVIRVFREGEGNYSDPIVEADEKINSREVRDIGDKLVLVLLTKHQDIYILRYFIKNLNNLGLTQDQIFNRR